MYEICDFLFQFYVQVEGAVEETAARTSRTIFVEGFLGLADDALIACKTGVGIGTEHQNPMSFHLNLGALLAGDGAEIRVHAHLHKLLRFAVIFVSFL